MREKDNYRKLAAQARTDADSAELENVRERCLRAETAWLIMAERAERTARLHQVNEVAKAHQEAKDAASTPGTAVADYSVRK